MGRINKINIRSLTRIVALMVLFTFAAHHRVAADEQLIDTNLGSGYSGSFIGPGEVETWTHTISADILSRATRLEAVVGAADIDYPDCSDDCPSCAPSECENDELWVNGNFVARLSGANDQTVANPVNIPLSDLVEGSNTFELRNIDVGIRWVVRVTSSTLSFYEEIPSVNPDPTPQDTPPQDIYALTLKKSQKKSSLLPGEIQQYRIEAINTGNTTLKNIVIIDDLTEDLNFTSNRAKFPFKQQGTRLSWNINALAAGQSAEVLFDATVAGDLPASRGISNSAVATANELSDTVQSNTVTAITSFTPVAPDELKVTKIVNRRESRIGRILVYRVRIDNKSSGNVFNLKLEDFLPHGMTFVPGSVLLDGSPYDDPRGSRRLSWDLGFLSGGQSTEIRYQVVIGTNVRRGRNINKAVVSGNDGGGNKVGGEDEALVMIGAGQVEVPAEILVTVFLDKNRNGQRNTSDPPLQDIDLILSTGQRKMTDKDGTAHFKELPSGHYGLAIHPSSLPEYTSIQGDETNLVRLIEGERLRLALPVNQDVGPARLNGTVYVDKNGNDQFDSGDTPLEGVPVVLDNQNRVRTKNGRYLFTDIESGEHSLNVNVNRTDIEQEVELSIGENTLDIAVPQSRLTISVEKVAD